MGSGSRRRRPRPGATTIATATATNGRPVASGRRAAAPLAFLVASLAAVALPSFLVLQRASSSRGGSTMADRERTPGTARERPTGASKLNATALLYEARDVPNQRNYNPPSSLDSRDKCAIYLAPSSVSSATDRPAGFGMYTAQQIPKGGAIFSRGSGPAVAVAGLERRADGHLPAWAGEIFMLRCAGFSIASDLLNSEEGVYPQYGDGCVKHTNNAGSLTNFHPVLANVAADATDVYRDDLLSPYDPGAGAFSHSLRETWRARRPIAAGEELFSSYGERWFFDDVLGRAGRNVPRRRHYRRAAEEIAKFLETHGNGTGRVSRKEVEAWHKGSRWTPFRDTKGRNVDRPTRRLIDRVAHNAEALEKLTRLADGFPDTQEKYDNQWRLRWAIGMQTTTRPSVDWIRAHGHCLDNLYPKRSTVLLAGQGGFAARQIKAGDVVVPAPTLVQVTNRTELDVYRFDAQGRRAPAPYAQQLLLNYCYGHDDSSLVLCPATNALLLNHCSTRMKGRAGQCDPGQGPNAVLRWAAEFDPETEEWLALSIGEIEERVKAGRRGLSLEVVALRDIAADEEVFLDYGIAWERAWQRHVASWRPPGKDDNFVHPVPVAVMNINVDEYLLTDRAKNLRIGCRLGGVYHPCTVRRRANATHYEATVRRWKGEGESAKDYFDGYRWPFAEDSVDVEVSGDGVRFFPGARASDVEGAFRHHVGVPEGLWPERWMNLRVSK